MGKRKYPKEIENDVIDYFKTCYSTYECAKKFNVSEAFIRYTLNKFNIPKFGMSELPEGIKELIIELYNEGFGVNAISAFSSIGKNRIYRLLRKNNIVIKKPNPIANYDLNHNYFKSIDNQEKAYFLGFLVADGSVRNNHININLQEEDKYILEIFKNLVEFTGDLKYINKSSENVKNQFRLSFSSSEIYNDLSKYGIVPRKSKITYFPDISEEFYSHFIRGVFDGDGSISTNTNNTKFNFDIAGSSKLVTSIQKILVENCNLNYTKILCQDETYRVRYGGRLDVLKIKEYLYKDANLFLIRKKEKFEQISV